MCKQPHTGGHTKSLDGSRNDKYKIQTGSGNEVSRNSVAETREGKGVKRENCQPSFKLLNNLRMLMHGIRATSHTS